MPKDVFKVLLSIFHKKSEISDRGVFFSVMMSATDDIKKALFMLNRA